MALKDLLSEGQKAFEGAVEAVKDPGAKGDDSLPDKVPEEAGGPASAPGVTENVSPGLATEEPAAEQPSSEVPGPAEPPVAPEPETPKAEVPEPAEPPVVPEPETPQAAPPTESPLDDDQN